MISTQPHRTCRHGCGRRLPLRSLVALAASLVLVAVATPSSAQGPRQPLLVGGDQPRVLARALTRDGFDRYTITASASTLDVTAAPTNTDRNTRMVLWRPDSPEVVDGETCAVWRHRSSRTNQLGAALRITHARGGVQAITITQNIYAIPFTFNVHTWDTTRPGPPLDPVGQFDMRQRFFAFGAIELPWRFCARAIADRVEFKVWSVQEREPAWGDPAHSDGITLPEGWVHPGHDGWYVGHLGAEESVRLEDPTLWAYRVEQSMIPRRG